MTLESQQ